MSKNNLGKILKKFRLKHGITQAQLANKLNVSASSIGMYEQGRRSPNNELLFKICSELGISMDYIIEASSEDNSRPAKEVCELIDNFTDILSSQEGLMFNGIPMSTQDRKEIVGAIKFATAIITSKNKNITDFKKYWSMYE